MRYWLGSVLDLTGSTIILGKAHRGGKSIWEIMTTSDKSSRAFMILTSLILPGVGIVLGVAIIIFLHYTDWPVNPRRPERENLHLGALCIVLGVINFAILLYLVSL